jgi:hypothetical protein
MGKLSRFFLSTVLTISVSVFSYAKAENSCVYTPDPKRDGGASCSNCTSKADLEYYVKMAALSLGTLFRSCGNVKEIEAPSKYGKYGATVYCDSCTHTYDTAKGAYSCFCELKNGLERCLDDGRARFKEHGGCSAVTPA